MQAANDKKNKPCLLRTRDGKLVELKPEARYFSDLINENDPDEEILVDLEEKEILVIKRFLEDHDYKAENIRVEKPLKSDILKDNIDEKSYNLLKDYAGIQNIEKIKPLVDAAYFLNFI